MSLVLDRCQEPRTVRRLNDKTLVKRSKADFRLEDIESETGLRTQVDHQAASVTYKHL